MTYRRFGALDVSSNVLPTVDKTLVTSTITRSFVSAMPTYTAPTYVAPMIAKEPELLLYEKPEYPVSADQLVTLYEKPEYPEKTLSTTTTYEKPVVYSPPSEPKEDTVNFIDPSMIQDPDTKDTTDPKTESDAVIQTLYQRDEKIKTESISPLDLYSTIRTTKPQPVLVENADGEQIDVADEGSEYVDPDPGQIGDEDNQYLNLDDETPPVEKSEGGFKWWWVALGVGAAGVGLWFLLGKKRRKSGRKG